MMARAGRNVGKKLIKFYLIMAVNKYQIDEAKQADLNSFGVALMVDSTSTTNSQVLFFSSD